jgi:hypothetical protein
VSGTAANGGRYRLYGGATREALLHQAALRRVTGYSSNDPMISIARQRASDSIPGVRVTDDDSAMCLSLV